MNEGETIMRKLLFLAILIVACASIAAAQSTEYNRAEIFGGYSHARIDTGIGDDDPDLDDIVDEREGFNGFNASVTGNLNRYFGVKFDVSGHFKKQTFPAGTSNLELDSDLWQFMGGVQLKDNSTETTFKPFAHVLVGAARASVDGRFTPTGGCIAVFPSPCSDTFEETDTGLAGAIGGGLDIRVGRRLDIRVIQFDYNPTRLFDSTQHNFRVGAGIVIH